MFSRKNIQIVGFFGYEQESIYTVTEIREAGYVAWFKVPWEMVDEFFDELCQLCVDQGVTKRNPQDNKVTFVWTNNGHTFHAANFYDSSAHYVSFGSAWTKAPNAHLPKNFCRGEKSKVLACIQKWQERKQLEAHDASTTLEGSWLW
jgi:hypothetical protein